MSEVHTAEQAKNMRSGINIEGKVTKGETRTVSKRTGGEIKVCDAKLEDSSGGTIKLTLWAEDIDKVPDGAQIKITNGYTSTFKGEPSLGKGKYGKIDVL